MPYRIPDSEIEIHAIRSSGAGGQNVNRVASAVELRFDIPASSLPAWLKERLLTMKDRRVTKDGCLVIKSQELRYFERNRLEALRRLGVIVDKASHVPKVRRPTRPTAGSKKRKHEEKVRRARIKKNRGSRWDGEG